MPHQCVKCNVVYDNDTTAVIDGCECGSKAFFFLKCPEKLEQAQSNITQEFREQVLTSNDRDEPVILDLESINTTGDGKYRLDLHALFGKTEVVVREEEGKYSVDLEETFRRHGTK